METKESKPKSAEIEKIGNYGYKMPIVSWNREGKMQWNKPAEGIIKELQEMRGANPRLRKHLRTKCMRVQSLLQSAYNELSQGIPLWNEKKREIEELLRYIANVSGEVQGNIKRLYNPETIKQNQGVIKLSSSENSTRASKKNECRYYKKRVDR